MTSQEEKFLKRLRATFRVEAEEHLREMASNLLDLEKKPPGEGQPAEIESVFRHAHSLKGAARAVNLGEVESVCQYLESLFAAWKHGKIDPSPEHFDTFHRAIDLIGQSVPNADGTLTALDKSRFSAIAGELDALGAEGRDTTEPPAPRESGDRSGSDRAAPETQPAPAASEKLAAAQTVRISLEKLDKLFLETEELLALKLAAARRASDLRGLQSMFDLWKSEWAKLKRRADRARSAFTPQKDSVAERARPPVRPDLIMNFLDWSAGHFKLLEGKLQGIGKAAEQDHAMAGRRINELLGDAKQLLMLPVSTLLDLFPKLARDLCREQGKEAELVIRGAEVEIDKRILEEIKDALIHLVRNCIDHGVEKPDVRARRNKAPRATITIAVSQVNGSNVELLVSDDGAGINLAGLKAAAVKRGVISASDARRMDDHEALPLIFQSEVSTSLIITEISGRGLGMAIAREKTEKLGGRITVESRPHSGTTFRILLPAMMAAFRGTLVRAGGREFVIPTPNIERVARLKPEAIQTVENRETVSLNGRTVSLARLERVLELPRAPQTEHATAFLPIVVLAAGDERIAFTVDEVIDEREVLIKRLAKPLVRVRNISGSTILASGDVAPILNPADLIKSARKAGSAPSAPPESVDEQTVAGRKRILLAEDSITSRMLLKGILESAGYQVKTAVDGMEAWTELRAGDFDLVVSDIEMPRMNGFDLTAQIRSDRKLADKPVILVTALSSREDRERGIDVGASAYIVKSNFDQSNLLEAVRRLI